jgi:hypothetical protein
MLRRIRELQAAGPAAGHVTGQHVISKVILKRFAEPSGPHQGLICPFRLDYPEARHHPLGPDGCGKVKNFVPWASASAEQLWKETEDRLSDALAVMDAGTLLADAGHVSVIKSAIGLHFARSKATWVIHAGVWVQTVERGRWRWLTENRRPLAHWFYLQKGLYPAGDEALGIFADEIMELSLTLGRSGALRRERIESMYRNARAMTQAEGLEILTAPAGDESGYSRSRTRSSRWPSCGRHCAPGGPWPRPSLTCPCSMLTSWPSGTRSLITATRCSMTSPATSTGRPPTSVRRWAT